MSARRVDRTVSVYIDHVDAVQSAIRLSYSLLSI